MLKIEIPKQEGYDPVKEEFVTFPGATLTLEHSLVSLSKWESKWKKPFLTKGFETPEDSVDYVRCMTITQNVDPHVYRWLTEDNYRDIRDYINDPMTATWFSEEQKGGRSKEIVTSELIYYWMVSLQIPMECQKWHLNRLLTLIRVCSIKNTPPKKMSKRDVMNRNRSLNAARRRALHTRG